MENGGVPSGKVAFQLSACFIQTLLHLPVWFQVSFSAEVLTLFCITNTNFKEFVGILHNKKS